MAHILYTTTPESPCIALMTSAANEIETLRATVDRVTAALALPVDTKPEDIVRAVRLCTKRCQELEHKVLAFQKTHVHRSPVDELQEIRDRIAALEAKNKP